MLHWGNGGKGVLLPYVQTATMKTMSNGNF